MRKRWIFFSAVYVMLFLGYWTKINVGAVAAQLPPVNSCSDIRFLMSQNITPYDLPLGGGTLTARGGANGNIVAGGYADFWSFTVTEEQDFNAVFALQAQDGAALEYALFRGLNRLTPFTAAGSAITFNMRQTGSYTVVVRRVHVSDTRDTAYSLSLDSSGGIGAPTVPEIRDTANNQPFGQGTANAPRLLNGVIQMRLEAEDVRFQAGSINQVQTRNGTASQVFIQNPETDSTNAYTLNVDAWVDRLYMLAGDLAASGTLEAGQRTYFVQRWDFEARIGEGTAVQSALSNITFPDNTKVIVDWNTVQGIWVLEECVGFRLYDGRTFVGALTAGRPDASTGQPVDPNFARRVEATGTLDAFGLTLHTLLADGTPQRYSLALNWLGVRAGSEVTLQDGVYAIAYEDSRDLSIQSSDLTLQGTAQETTATPRLDAELRDVAATVALDWTNINRFGLNADTIALRFTDAPRGETSRSALNLERFSALNDVIDIRYKPATPDANNAASQLGERRLLLPRSEGYVELVTPAGLPSVDGAALPDMDGYSPRGLNNTGGECYPANTILAAANCPPNGHPNAANGNLWLSFTDHIASGDLFDLTLSRNYNSRLAAVDSPFGFGWTTDYLLDYTIAFDPTTASRPVTPGLTYPVALDLTWAPRGYVTFITATGSRHVFTIPNGNSFESGEMRALTMPGWRLTYPEPNALRWVLQQNNGATYEFDRAGRLRRYGIDPDLSGRAISIDYPYAELTGTGGLGERPVIITDAASLRQLELYYDSQHHIVRSILRDLTTNGDAAACNATENCFETRYTYQDGFLTEVTYADGSVGRYGYDGGRLVEVADPHAPIAPSMVYGYSPNGDITSAQIATPEGLTNWRTLTYKGTNTTREVTVVDDLNAARDYTYTLEALELRRTGNAYTLAEETSPLADPSQSSYLQNVPVQYAWENGLLRQEIPRILGAQIGRNGSDYVYTTNGDIACIACNLRGQPELRMTFSPTPEEVAARHYPSTINYNDGSSETFDYNANNLVDKHTDRNGAVYDYEWSSAAPYQVVSRTRQSDGVRESYTYNAVGLVLTMTVDRLDTTGAALGAPRTVSYTYDGLGRVLAMTDDTLGTYAVGYPLPQQDANGEIIRTVIVTDPTGVATSSLYQLNNRLVAQVVMAGETVLRQTVYRYDILGRLLAEERWLSEGETNRPIATTYRYTLVDTIDPLLPGEPPITLRGYQVVSNSEEAGTTTYYYDALHRLRRVIDPQQRFTDYRYEYAGLNQPFGEQIVQRIKLSGENAARERRYTFGTLRELREIQEADLRWTLYYDGESTRPTVLEPSVGNRRVAVQSINWGEYGYSQGRPVGVRVVQGPVELFTDFDVPADHTPNLRVTYDVTGAPTQIFRGRTSNLTSPNGDVISVAYCPDAAGTIRHVYGLDGQAASCEVGANFSQQFIYDAAGRLLRADDEYGQRTLAYYPLPEAHVWEVIVDLTDPLTNATYKWTLRYNGVGEILYWLDEYGTEHAYTYDTLGRLTTVVTAQQPEASYTFTYNDANLLTQVQDGAGRGTAYNYNERNLVISQLDIRTAQAFSYAYTPTGRLNTVIAPQGETTTYRYEDPNDPTRLTSVIDPSGSERRFNWNDENNELIYTDPLNRTSSYLFDGTGMLWRINDALPLPTNATPYRVIELRHDSAANFTGWLMTTNDGEQNAARRLTLTPDNGNGFVVTEPRITGWSQALGYSTQGLQTQVGDLVFDYDPLYRLQRLQPLDDPETAWSLNWTTGATSVIVDQPFGDAQTLTFDFLGRLIQRQVAGVETRFGYTPDTANAITTLTVSHPVLGERQYVVSPGDSRRNLPPSVILKAFGQEVTYNYDLAGRLTEIFARVCSQPAIANIADCSDGIWESRSRLEYDAGGLLTQAIDADGHRETFSYNNAGELVTYQAVNGRSFNYRYDGAGRLVSVTNVTGGKLLLAYDTADNLTGICRTRSDASDVYEDCLGSGTEVLGMAYDALGRLREKAFPNVGGNGGRTTVAYQYAPNGLLAGYDAVSLSYTALGLIETLDLGGGTAYTFGYSDLNQLAEVGDLAFGYDDQGATNRVTVGRQELTYSRDLAGNLTITDSTGRTIQYTVNDRGYVQQVDADGQPLFVGYPGAQNDLELIFPDGTAASQFGDVRGFVRDVLYFGSSSLTIYNQPDALGFFRTQSRELLDSGIDYNIVAGYDNDDRPVTLRVTDRQGLQVLYTLALTYDGFGRRNIETRQFNDGVQVILRHDYGDAPEPDTPKRTQLQATQITIVRPLVAAGMGVWGLVIGLGALVLVGVIHNRYPHWPLWALIGQRSQRVSAVLAVALTALMLGTVVQLRAQQLDDIYNLRYSYDAAGNVARIEIEGLGDCARFAYDGLNRLTNATYSNPLNSASVEVSADYRYDAFNRVVTLGATQVVYQGGTRQIHSLQAGGANYTFVTNANQPPLMVLDGSGAAITLVSDGRERPLQVLDAEGATQAPLLFDSFGRRLSLESPAPDISPCQLSGNPPIHPALQVQSLMDGRVWDSATGLYFSADGRAYSAELGRFLQRDPLNTDVLGNVYDFPAHGVELPLPLDTPSYSEGLYVLRDAEAQLAINERLSATAVRNIYASVSLDPRAEITQDLDEASAQYEETLQQLLVFPEWLATRYNLTAPTLDPQTGYVVVYSDRTVAQGGLRGDSPNMVPLRVPNWSALLDQPQWNTAAIVTQLGATQTANANRLFQPYARGSWVVAPPSVLDGFSLPSVPVALDYSAEAVFNSLPRTLETPHRAAALLDVVEAVNQLPETPLTSHIETALAQALPQAPTLPPESLEAWRATYFTNNSFGIEGAIQEVLPPLPETPLYRIGTNPTWLFVVE